MRNRFAIAGLLGERCDSLGSQTFEVTPGAQCLNWGVIVSDMEICDVPAPFCFLREKHAAL